MLNLKPNEQYILFAIPFDNVGNSPALEVEVEQGRFVITAAEVGKICISL